MEYTERLKSIEQTDHIENVFIIYHPEDIDLAAHLEKVLKNYRPPDELGGSGTPLKIFKDAHDLPDDIYYTPIRQRFEQCQKLVVVCTPRARQNNDLDEKIRKFAVQNGARNIVPVIFEGLPNHLSENEKKEFGALPDVLYELLPNPHWVNFNGFNLQKDRLHKEGFESEWYTLLAELCGEKRLDLAQRERNRGFRRRRNRLLAISTLLVVLVTAAAFYLQKYYGEIAARERALKLALVDENRQNSQQMFSENRVMQALFYASDALDAAPDAELRSELLAESKKYEPVLRLGQIFRHQGEISGATFNPDYTEIFTWGDRGKIKRWHAKSGAAIAGGETHQGAVNGIRFTQSGEQVLSWGEDGFLKLWSITGTSLPKIFMEHGDGVVDAQFNQSETRVISIGKNFSARIFQLPEGKPQGAPLEHDGWINGVLLNTDESILLTWSDDSTLKCWNTADGRLRMPPMRHEGAVQGAIWYKNESQIISWATDGEVRFWHSRTGHPAGRILKHTAAISGVRLNQNETRLLSWGRDNTARLWQVEERLQIGDPLYHDGWVFGAAFNKSETRVLTWSYDNSARIWDTNTGKQVGNAFTHSSGPLGNDAGIFGAAFNSAGDYILTWGDDNTTRLWSIRTGRQLGASLHHDNKGRQNHEVRGCVFNPDFTRVITWSSDSTARYWESLKQISDDYRNDAILDLDFPQNAYKMQMMALTGTRMDSASRQIESLSDSEWDSLSAAVGNLARKHARKCDYPEGNLWLRFFPPDK